jgi:hypothetical protein
MLATKTLSPLNADPRPCSFVWPLHQQLLTAVTNCFLLVSVFQQSTDILRFGEVSLMQQPFLRKTHTHTHTHTHTIVALNLAFSFNIVTPS